MSTSSLPHFRTTQHHQCLGLRAASQDGGKPPRTRGSPHVLCRLLSGFPCCGLKLIFLGSAESVAPVLLSNFPHFIAVISFPIIFVFVICAFLKKVSPIVVGDVSGGRHKYVSSPPSSRDFLHCYYGKASVYESSKRCKQHSQRGTDEELLSHHQLTRNHRNRANNRA